MPHFGGVSHVKDLGGVSFPKSSSRGLFPKLKHNHVKWVMTGKALGHHLIPFAPYGDKEYAYCENPSGGEG